MASSLFFSSSSSSSLPSARSDLRDPSGGDRRARVSLPLPLPRRGRGRGRGWRSAAAGGGAGRRYKGTAMREEALTEMIERKVAEAMEACAGEEGQASDGCRVAWDEVEEVSQAKADLRRRRAETHADPLEPFCRHNPDSDECRVYDD
ncbi:calvin cycle protein CP12-3, chloroplastic [Ananas comosus]|uniref:Calvin cycle protein CP12-3, chloroplastic n=2 Tax=Ananas comosus TaxID=4615 RepID=A0A6P5H2G3_ANACO|nr:calvin cycle protein CP12-3, chloroplastic [Ananas comosus]